jgi:hypothetical protein
LSRHLFQQLCATRQKRDSYLPPVALAPGSVHKSMCLQTIDQFHGAVMLQCHAVGYRSDGGFRTPWQAAYRQ